MKKLLIVLGILLCTLTSCEEVHYKEVDDRKVEMITPDNDYGIKYVEFDGHEYVYLSRGYGRSMCHSPKCHCLIEYKK